MALVLCVFIGGPSTCSVSASEARSTLTLGLFPYFSPRKLLEIHKPLKAYLMKRLDLEISMVTAPDFSAFEKRTAEGRYDLIVTAPHLARLAELESGYRRVVMSTHRGRAVFLVRKDSDLRRLEDLKGKTVALPPPKAIIHHVALRTLRKHGLEAGKTIQIQMAPSHNSAMLSVVSRRTDAAVMGKAPWESIRERYGTHLRMIGTSVEIPGFMVMANPGLPLDILDAVQTALLDFHLTEEGASYFTKSALKGFVVIDDDCMKELDTYLKAMFWSK